MYAATKSLELIVRWTVVAAFIATTNGPAVAQETTDLAQQLTVTLGAFREEYGFPGATAAYVLPNGEVGVAAIGLADERTSTAMTPRSPMLAASIRVSGFIVVPASTSERPTAKLRTSPSAAT